LPFPSVAAWCRLINELPARHAESLHASVALTPWAGEHSERRFEELLAGQIDPMFEQAANALPQVRAGKIRAYAVAAKTRLPSAPDIPSVDQAGLPGF
jgi:tripartite-type tricarboxylate transporter receptor subunit TctC